MLVIRGVTLDLWQTLIRDSREVGQKRFQHRMAGIRALLAKEGVPVDDERLRQAARACFEACEGIRGQERELLFHDQVDLFLGLVKSGLPSRLPTHAVAQIRDVYGSMAVPHTPTLIPGALDVVLALRADGFRLALISNTGVTPGAIIRKLLSEMRLLEHLEVLVFSDEVGMVKPAEGIFRAALEQMGLSPEETVHVGDHPRADVWGARRVGMWAVQVLTPERREPVEGAEPHVAIPDVTHLQEALRRLQDGAA